MEEDSWQHIVVVVDFLVEQRTAEQIVVTSDPPVVEKLVEVSRNFHQDKIQQRFVEQTDETPDISLEEKIVEKPVFSDARKHATRCEDACSARRPTVAVHRQVVDIPVVAQRKIFQLQYTDDVVDVPAVLVVLDPRCKPWKTVEIPHLQIVKKVVEIPEIQMVQGTQTPESFGFCTCPPSGTGGNCGGGRDRSASARRIRTTLVRHCTRLSRPPIVWALDLPAMGHRRNCGGGRDRSRFFLQNPHHPCSTRHPSRQTSESLGTAPCPPSGTRGNFGDGRVRCASSCSTSTHVRHSTRLGGSSCCCGACTTASFVECETPAPLSCPPSCNNRCRWSNQCRDSCCFAVAVHRQIVDIPVVSQRRLSLGTCARRQVGPTELRSWSRSVNVCLQSPRHSILARHPSFELRQ